MNTAYDIADMMAKMNWNLYRISANDKAFEAQLFPNRLKLIHVKGPLELEVEDIGYTSVPHVVRFKSDKPGEDGDARLLTELTSGDQDIVRAHYAMALEELLGYMKISASGTVPNMYGAFAIVVSTRSSIP